MRINILKQILQKLHPGRREKAERAAYKPYIGSSPINVNLLVTVGFKLLVSIFLDKICIFLYIKHL